MTFTPLPIDGTTDLGPPATAGSAHLAEVLVAAGFAVATVVPGRPATSVQDALAARGATVIDAGNERTAAEMAFGLSVGGRPALVVVKGSGGWLVAEALQNMVAHGIGAPLLVLVGDDVTASASTVPTDARDLGVVGLPVVDLRPGPSGEPALHAAIALSARTSRPAIVRFTDLVEQPVSPGGVTAVAAPSGARPEQGGLAHTLTKWSRYERSLAAWDEVCRAEAAPPGTADPAPPAPATPLVVVAAGAMAAVVAEAVPDVPTLAVDTIAPFPHGAVVRAATSAERVLVIEEGQPVVEDLVQLSLARHGLPTPVVGQRSGHVPRPGARTAVDVVRAVAGAARPAEAAPPGPLAPHPQASPTRFDTVLAAVAAATTSTAASVHACVGSCIASAYPPHAVATTALELGAPIAVASGAALATGRPAIALIGDYGLVHSALDDHDLVHQHGWPVLTIVLADGASAKTGGQPSAVSAHAPGRPLPLRRALTRLAPADRVEVVAVEATTEEALADVVRRALEDLPRTLVVTAGDDVVLD